MFSYQKKLQYPVKIDKPNPKLASIIFRNMAVQTENWAPLCATCLSATPCPSMS